MNCINELERLLFQNLNWNKARIACLAQILQALICTRTVNLTQISTFFKSNAKQDSSYRRIRRFFSEFSLDITLIIPFILALFSLKSQLILILDRTNWKWGKRDINILLLSVAYRGIAIPLFWSVSSSAGSSSTVERISILKKILQQIGPGRIQAFLADREFIGDEWFKFLKKAKIPFIIRIKKNTMAEGIRPYPIPVLELWKNRGRLKSIINAPVLIWGHLLYVSITQAKGAKEPMIVVSNKTFGNAIHLYQRRWEIETLFGCLKGRGFNLEDTHMTAPEKIEKLLFVLTIAFCWSYKIGVIKDSEKAIPKKTHGRLSRSLFRLGLDCFRSVILFIEKEIHEFRKLIKILTICKLTS
ncbi:MAG: IS4 family transposase [Chlamydiales bacterium]|nr:IS4 family transposase [Chlamydiales bacterium]